MNQTKQNEFNSFYAHGRITELAFINNFTKQNEMGKLTTSHENNYNNRMNGNVSGVINIHGTTIYSSTVCQFQIKTQMKYRLHFHFPLDL